MKRTTHIMPLCALLTCAFTLDATAQAFALTEAPASAPARTTVEEVTVHNIPEILHMDLSSRSAAWWKSVRRDHASALRTSSYNTRVRAMQNIICFATLYPRQSNMNRIAREVYEVYQFDTDERLRIMAVHAQNVIGDRNTLHLLAGGVSQESSPRVRRQVLAALADHPEIGYDPRSRNK